MTVTNKSVFSAEFQLSAYGRMSDLIEQTGNEDTLGVILDARLHYIKEYKYADIEANFKGRVYEPISYKSRFYEDMSPPLFDFTEMNIAVIMTYGTIRIGVLESYLKNWSNENFNVGAAGYVTQFGSIPIKEFGDSINAFFYYNTGGTGTKFTVGAEWFWFRHGIMDSNEYTPGGSNENNNHSYKPGYYTDFSIQTFAGRVPYYAMSGFLFFEVVNAWKFDILTHVGVHDNNIYSNSDDVFMLKYRAFLRITFNVTDDFKIIFSDTFTYDPVFKNNVQYYELENRYQLGVISYAAANGGHYTVDNDMYLGVVYKFGTKAKPPRAYTF
jgi:hypothetical protein